METLRTSFVMRTRHVLLHCPMVEISSLVPKVISSHSEEIFDAKKETPVTTCIVLDGAATVQMLKPAASKTFEEYTHQIFIPYVSAKLQTVSRLDLIWDTYLIH